MQTLGAALIMGSFGISIYMSFLVWTALGFNMWKWGMLTFVLMLGHISAAIITRKKN